MKKLIILLSALFVFAADINICDDSAQWPPFTFYQKTDNGKKLTGLTVELVDEVFKRIHKTYNIDLIPWKRCLYLVKNYDKTKKYEMFMDGTYTKQRAKDYYLTSPIYSTHNVAWFSTKKFTKEQIQEKMEELDQIPTFLKSIYSKEFNDTEMAIMLLEEEYTQEKNKKRGGFFGLFGSKEKGDIGKERIDAEGTGKFSRLFSPGDTEKNENDLSFMIESLYPKSTRKEGQTPDKRLVDVFMNDVVAATNLFIPSSDKISVPGGWVR